MKVVAAFLEPASADARAAFTMVEESALEAQLQSLFDASKAEHPAVDVELVDFARHLGERVESPEELRRLEVADLMLALGCLRGCRVALEVFERTFVPEIARTRKLRDLGERDDTVQEITAQLLLPRGSKPARLSGYGGRGPLLHWVRVVATRMTLDAYRARERREGRALSESDLDLIAPPNVPVEDTVLREHFAPVIKRALQAALDDLPPRLRLVLRQRLVDELSLREIGRLHNAEHKKVGRWVESARKQVWQGFCGRLAADHALGSQELQSLVRGVHNQLDLSLSRILS